MALVNKMAKMVGAITESHPYKFLMTSDGWLHRRTSHFARLLFYGIAAACVASVFLVPPAFFITSFLVSLALTMTYVAHRRDMNCFGHSLFSWVFSRQGMRSIFTGLMVSSLTVTSVCVMSLAGLFAAPFVVPVMVPIVLVTSLVFSGLFAYGRSQFSVSKDNSGWHEEDNDSVTMRPATDPSDSTAVPQVERRHSSADLTVDTSQLDGKRHDSTSSLSSNSSSNR